MEQTTPHMNQMAPESLQSVGRELSMTLQEARQSLEDFAEGKKDQESIRICVECLHTAQGVLRLVELYGAALLAEEMEQVAEALINEPGKREQDRLDVLSRAMVQLPTYLDRVIAGGRDVPLVVLPLLNDLRAVRSSPLLTENTLFLLNLSSSRQPASPADATVEPLTPVQIRTQAKLIRRQFLANLLAWMTGRDPEQHLAWMYENANMLTTLAPESSFGQLWRVAAGVLEAMRDVGLEASVAVKSLLGQADQQIRRLIQEGLKGFAEAPPNELLNNLLYYVARATSSGTVVRALKTEYGLDELLPSEDDIEREREGLAGPSPSLMKTVGAAIRDDLAQVKDGLDIFMRTGRGRVEELEPLVDMLRKVSDTLNVLGLGHLSAQVRSEIERLNEVIAGNLPHDEPTLMQTASTLLKLESRLEERLMESVGATATEEETALVEGESGGELKLVTSAVMRESLVNLARVKDSISQYFTHADRTRPLDAIAALMAEIKSAVLMLGKARAGEILEQIDAQLATWKDKGITDLKPGYVDRLADAIVSLEYYMETIQTGRADPEYMLDNAERCLDSLQEEPTVAVAEGEPSKTTVLEEAEPAEIADDTVVKTVLMQRPQFETDTIQPPVFVSAEDRVDPEFLELFIEEAKEEVETLTEYFPQWRDNPTNLDALATIRRSFHTLKGSGRMVGAQLIGEYAWAMENLLNRLLDGTLQRTEDMIYLLESALTGLPELIEQLEAGTRPTVDADTLIRQAWALSETEMPGDVSITISPGDMQKTAVMPRLDENGPTEVIPTLKDGGERATVVTGPAPESTEPDATTVIPTLTVEPTEEVEHVATQKVEQLNVELPSEESPGEESPLEGVAIEISEDEGESATELDIELQPEPSEEIELDIDLLDLIEAAPGGEEATGADLTIETPAVELSMEPALYEIFSHEATGHIETLRQFVDQCDEIEPPFPVTDELHRACHTLHGSAEMADVKRIADLVAPLDHFISEAYRSGTYLPEAIVGVLADTASAIEEIVDKINLPGVYQTDHQALRARILELEADSGAEAIPTEGFEVGEFTVDEALAEEVEADTVVTEAVEITEERPELIQAPAPEEQALADEADEFDAEIAEIFSAEAKELLEAADEALHQWTEAPGSAEYVSALQRHLHTVKGGARMAGVAGMGDLSHELESLVKDAAEGLIEPTGKVFETLQAALDELQRMRDLLANGQPTGEIDPWLQRIRALYPSGRRIEIEEPSVESTREPEPVEPVSALPEAPVPERPELQVQPPESLTQDFLPPEPPRAAVSPEEMKGDRQEIARVSAELLQQLLNNAGEVSIFRARIEQSLSASGQNLLELSQTTARLHEQLRKLEIETEKQILHRHLEEGRDRGEFDPLEMDRYSTIQQLSRALVETANDLNSLREMLEELVRESETLLLQQGRVTTELQDGLMRTRMVPFRQHAQRLSRIVRQTAADVGKRAELHLTGEDGEMDRQMLERMLPPLEHMLRNAVIHGLEEPDVRHSRDKPELGSVYIKLQREAADMVMEVSDDGQGIDVKALTERARAVGLLRTGQDVDEHDAMQLVFEPGLTTAEEVTLSAGRGVGMDVVATEVRQLGGSIDIESVRGRGTTFRIRLPFTLAVSQSLLVIVGTEVYALPMPTIEGVTRAPSGDIQRALSSDDKYFEYGGHKYELVFLSALLRLPLSRITDEDPTVPVVLVRTGEHSAGLIVDGLMGAREIVVKTVGPQISSVRGISGATILGDGRTALILDVGALVRAGARGLIPEAIGEEAEDQRIFALVVDDSITVRRVTQRLLERNGMRVMTAKDGVDAVAILQEHLPDIILLDIEMPRMDGYEVAQHVRGDERLAKVPIIMITSRVGLKHRARAIELGVDDYLGKPYQESELLAAIDPLVTGKKPQ